MRQAQAKTFKQMVKWLGLMGLSAYKGIQAKGAALDASEISGNLSVVQSRGLFHYRQSCQGLYSLIGLRRSDVPQLTTPPGFQSRPGFDFRFLIKLGVKNE